MNNCKFIQKVMRSIIGVAGQVHKKKYVVVFQRNEIDG